MEMQSPLRCIEKKKKHVSRSFTKSPLTVFFFFSPLVFSQWLQTLLACNTVRLFYLFKFLSLCSQCRAGNQAGEAAIIAAATQAVNQLGRQTLLAVSLNPICYLFKHFPTELLS